MWSRGDETSTLSKPLKKRNCQIKYEENLNIFNLLLFIVSMLIRRTSKSFTQWLPTSLKLAYMWKYISLINIKLKRFSDYIKLK